MIRMQDVVSALYRMEWRCHAFRENDITWEIGRIQQELFVSEKSANTNGRLPNLVPLTCWPSRHPSTHTDTRSPYVHVFLWRLRKIRNNVRVWLSKCKYADCAPLTHRYNRPEPSRPQQAKFGNSVMSPRSEDSDAFTDVPSVSFVC